MKLLTISIYAMLSISLPARYTENTFTYLSQFALIPTDPFCNSLLFNDNK